MYKVLQNLFKYIELKKYFRKVFMKSSIYIYFEIGLPYIE